MWASLLRYWPVALAVYVFRVRATLTKTRPILGMVYRGLFDRGLFDSGVRVTTPAACALLAHIPNLAEFSYVKRVNAAVSREDAVDLEACLSMNPRAIPGGQRLMESGLSDVRETRGVRDLSWNYVNE